MSIGFIDPITKKYVKKAGDMNILNTPVATKTSAGLMSAEDKKKLDEYTPDIDIASDEAIINIFN